MSEIEIEIAKNVAANGRLFCFMVFVAWIAVFLAGYGGLWSLKCSLFPILSVGLVVLRDTTPPGRLRSAANLAAYTLAATGALLLLNVR